MPGVHWTNVVTDYGADNSGEEDASVAIQRAINASGEHKNPVVYFPAGFYLLNNPLNLTDRGDRPITLVGDGTTQTGNRVLSPDPATTLLGNTGNSRMGSTCVIDTVGSQYVSLRDFRVVATKSMASDCLPRQLDKKITSPSRTGILMGRSGKYSFAQFHNYERIMLFMDSLPSASPRGTIGIYNVGAENWLATQVRVIADLPFAFASTDVLAIPSIATRGGPASMTLCDLIQTTALAFSHAGYEFWDSSNVHLRDVYTNRHSLNTSMFAFNFNNAAIRSIHITGQVEEWPAVAHFNFDASGLTIDCFVNEATKSYVWLESGVTLSGSRIRIEQANGAQQTLFNAGVNSRLLSSQVTLFDNQAIVAPNLKVLGCHFQGNVLGAPIMVRAASKYLIQTSTLNQFEST
jgi:Pectate lyase superfamily protein